MFLSGADRFIYMYYEIEALRITKYPDKMLILSKLLFLENLSTKLFVISFLVGNPWTFGTESPDDTVAHVGLCDSMYSSSVHRCSVSVPPKNRIL